MKSVLHVWRRALHVSAHHYKVKALHLSGRSKSSQHWIIRQLNDPYVKRARYESYRARSAFKLIEMDDEFSLLSPGMLVVECGASPGSWTQVLVKRLKLSAECPHPTGAVIAVDIQPIHEVEGAIMMPKTDFTKALNQAKILHALNGKPVDLVCSDMAPNTCGIACHDHLAIMKLCYSALQFAVTVLRPISGAFLTKCWDGEQTPIFKQDLCKFFTDVRFVKPDASRGDSTEFYWLARNFKGLKHV